MIPEPQEIIPEITEPEIIEQVEEILIDNSSNEANEFVIEETPQEK